MPEVITINDIISGYFEYSAHNQSPSNKVLKLERIYKPHYDYQNFSPLANGTDLNRQKYAILQTHWH